MTAKSRVVVAMSGGVDSSVAAALLKNQGYDVVGIMLRLWTEPGTGQTNRCCSPESVSLARRVAGSLDIPFHVIDAKAIFRDVVVQAFLDGYAAGDTPNPCIACNRQIRWTFLLEHALVLGAAFLATGHYARVETGSSGSVRLLRACDAAKDQSYVLHMLSQSQLRRAIFPVGELTKAQVRKLASDFSLPTATRHDSQDLCFLGGGDYRDFLRRNRPEALRPGEIVTSAGAVLGRHGGLANYTVGQRKGLGIRSLAPLYVLRKDAASNRLVVGGEQELGERELFAYDISWIGGVPATAPFRALVKTRYTARAAAAEVVPLDGGNRVRVIFDEPQRDITAGQAAVFYKEDDVLGGGTIRQG
jgi:tRNA-uridine 2-sulfurtransferase